MLADSFDDKVRSNSILVVGKRMVKGCTDKVKLASVAKNLFFWKIARQAVVHIIIQGRSSTYDTSEAVRIANGSNNTV